MRQQAFQPAPGNFPATGDDTIAGGIFCISLTDLATYLQKAGNNPAGTGSESPNGAGMATSGSGPYPAQQISDPDLPGHSVFAPKEKPNITMPFIAWANGACTQSSAPYKNFLIEIASHGYVIAADGPLQGGGSGQSKVSDMRASIDWAMDGGADKYGDVDTERIATAGHSCGGLEGMSTAYHDERVKRILMFDIAIFQDDRRYLLQEINVPVAWFVGGPSDMGYPNVSPPPFLPPSFLQPGIPRLKEVSILTTFRTGRLRRTTACCLRVSRPSRPAWIPATAALSRPRTAASLARLRLHTWNGSLGTTPRRKTYVLTPSLREALCLTTGLWISRIGRKTLIPYYIHKQQQTMYIL